MGEIWIETVLHPLSLQFFFFYFPLLNSVAKINFLSRKVLAKRAFLLSPKVCLYYTLACMVGIAQAVGSIPDRKKNYFFYL